MDTPVVLLQIPVQFRFLAKVELFKIPLLGDHLKRAGHIPAPRDDPRAAVNTLGLIGRDRKPRAVFEDLPGTSKIMRCLTNMARKVVRKLA